MTPTRMQGTIGGRECVAELVAKNKWLGTPGDRFEMWSAEVMFLAPTPGMSSVRAEFKPLQATSIGALDHGIKALKAMGFKLL